MSQQRTPTEHGGTLLIIQGMSQHILVLLPVWFQQVSCWKGEVRGGGGLGESLGEPVNVRSGRLVGRLWVEAGEQKSQLTCAVHGFRKAVLQVATFPG